MIFFEKMRMMISLFFFLKMNEAWPNAPSLWIDAWLMKTLKFEEKMIFFLFFFKMDEAWPNAPVWQYMWIFKKLYCTTIFFGVKNKAKMDPRCEWKHKIRQLGHGWARCQSALLECQSAFEKCKLALQECLIWGANKRTQFFPNSLFFFPMCFLCFWVFF